MATEKRFVYYEHKGADYILENPNTDLDFIEMLGDCLEAEEIVDLLNKLHEENERLKKYNNKLMKQPLLFDVQTIPNTMEIMEANNKLEEENEQLKQQKDKWKQQCIHFKEMLDDMDITYLCDEWIYGELKGDLE